MATPTKKLEDDEAVHMRSPRVQPLTREVEGSNTDPTVVGGLQPIYCPQCKEEVKALDSYQLSTDNKRYHYPVCWQKHELGIG